MVKNLTKKEKSNKGFFRVKNNKILLLRVGSANGQIQHHFYKATDYYGNELSDPEDIDAWKRSIRRPPTRKGIFTFPAPLDDAFYYYHYYEKFLPKELSTKNPFIMKSVPYGVYRNFDERDEHLEYIRALQEDLFYRKNKKYKEIIAREKQKRIWHGGEFYSHVCPKNLIDDGRVWWKYNNVSEWVESARKYLYVYHSFQHGGKNLFCGKIRVDRGFFEIFIPD